MDQVLITSFLNASFMSLNKPIEKKKFSYKEANVVYLSFGNRHLLLFLGLKHVFIDNYLLISILFAKDIKCNIKRC